FVLDRERGIGYVRIDVFTEKTSADFNAALSDLKSNGLKGLVLDLRFNQGGLLRACLEVADTLVDDGLIVTLRKRGGQEVVHKGKHEGSQLDFPLVVLVNGDSASGTEIVAACVQDHSRGVVMGERTYGQASVQDLHDFDGGTVRMTTASFWRPSGKNLDKAS